MEEALVGSSHFCSNFFFLAQEKSDLGSFLLRLRQPSYWTQRMEFDSSAGGVGASCPQATPQVGSVATSIEGREAPTATTSAWNNNPTAGPLAPGAPQWSPGAAQAPKTGIRAPHSDEKAAVARERVSKLDCGTQSGWGRRHSSQLPRGVEESPPASSASVNVRQGCAMREFLGTGQEEGGSRQRVGFASPDRVDTVECRGRRRGATVGDTSSRVGAPPVSSCCSRHVSRGGEVASSGGTIVEGEGRWPSPHRPESQVGVSSGRLCSTVRRGDARVDRGSTERSSSGHCGRAAPRSVEGLPTLVHSIAGVATDYPGTVFGNAVRSGEHCEMIRVRCGMAGVLVGGAARTGESLPSMGQFFRRGSWGGCHCKGVRGGQ